MSVSLRWLLYAGNRLAPLRRKRAGAYTPETRWRLYAGNRLAPMCRKMTAGAYGCAAQGRRGVPAQQGSSTPGSSAAAARRPAGAGQPRNKMLRFAAWNAFHARKRNKRLHGLANPVAATEQRRNVRGLGRRLGRVPPLRRRRTAGPNVTIPGAPARGDSAERMNAGRGCRG